MTRPPAVEVTNLGKGWAVRDRPRGARRWVTALEGLSLSVAPGEALGLVGRNGAGKSTLLSLLARITPPTQGRAVLRGRVAALLEVGTGFHPELTGRENALLNAVLLGLSRAQARERLGAIVAFAEVGPVLDLPLKRWSTGQGLRLAFSVAAHLEPDVLLVDEVLAVGDAGFRARCLERLEGLARAGTAIVLVSHDEPALRRLCGRSAWLEAGRLAALGPTAEVLSAYARLGTPACTDAC